MTPADPALRRHLPPPVCGKGFGGSLQTDDPTPTGCTACLTGQYGSGLGLRTTCASCSTAGFKAYSDKPGAAACSTCTGGLAANKAGTGCGEPSARPQAPPLDRAAPHWRHRKPCPPLPPALAAAGNLVSTFASLKIATATCTPALINATADAYAAFLKTQPGVVPESVQVTVTCTQVVSCKGAGRRGVSRWHGRVHRPCARTAAPLLPALDRRPPPCRRRPRPRHQGAGVSLSIAASFQGSDAAGAATVNLFTQCCPSPGGAACAGTPCDSPDLKPLDITGAQGAQGATGGRVGGRRRNGPTAHSPARPRLRTRHALSHARPAAPPCLGAPPDPCDGDPCNTNGAACGAQKGDPAYACTCQAGYTNVLGEWWEAGRRGARAARACHLWLRNLLLEQAGSQLALCCAARAEPSAAPPHPVTGRHHLLRVRQRLLPRERLPGPEGRHLRWAAPRGQGLGHQGPRA
jgi:hypothetical protein